MVCYGPRISLELRLKNKDMGEWIFLKCIINRIRTKELLRSMIWDNVSNGTRYIELSGRRNDSQCNLVSYLESVTTLTLS